MQIMNRPLTGIVQDLDGALNAHGRIVAQNPLPENLNKIIIGIQESHGVARNASRYLANSEKMHSHFEHQNAIRDTAKRIVEIAGEERTHFILENKNRFPDDWPAPVKEKLIRASQFEGQQLQELNDPNKLQKHFRDVAYRITRCDKRRERNKIRDAQEELDQACEQWDKLSGGLRTAGSYLRNNKDRFLHGHQHEDEQWEIAMTQLQTNYASAQDPVTKEYILSQMGVVTANYYRTSHQGILTVFQEDIPDNSVAVVFLGAAHFRSGEMITLYPECDGTFFEDYIGGIRNALTRILWPNGIDKCVHIS